MRRDQFFKNEDDLCDYIYDRKREREINRELERDVPNMPGATNGDELKAERFTQRMPTRIAAYQSQPPKPESNEPKLPFVESE